MVSRPLLPLKEILIEIEGKSSVVVFLDVLVKAVSVKKDVIQWLHVMLVGPVH